MAFKEPESMDDLLFFTNRTLEDKGKIRAWVWRPKCPKCKGKMGKPLNPKTGKVIKKAEYFECHDCHKQLTEQELEDIAGQELEVIYTCPYCSFSGEAKSPYKRKSWQGVQAYLFECGKCKKTIGITKKMKEPKKKTPEVTEAEIPDEE